MALKFRAYVSGEHQRFSPPGRNALNQELAVDGVCGEFQFVRIRIIGTISLEVRFGGKENRILPGKSHAGFMAEKCRERQIRRCQKRSRDQVVQELRQVILAS